MARHAGVPDDLLAATKPKASASFCVPLVFVMTLVAALSNPVSRWFKRGGPKHVADGAYRVAALLGTRRSLSPPSAVAYLMRNASLSAKTGSFYRLFSTARHADELISRSSRGGSSSFTASIIIIVIWAHISYGTSWIDNSLISTSFITGESIWR